MSKIPALRSAFVRILLLSCLVVAATGLWAEPPKKVNVIFFALDQLQANRLHSYGNPRETSPNIDRLAQRGTRFTHFFTVAPWTSPSFRFPSHFSLPFPAWRHPGVGAG